MRKLIVMLAAVAMLASASRASAAAVDAYDDSQAHPLRILGFIIHPLAYTLEWLVTRPIHEIVAQPNLAPIFGHTPHGQYGDPQVDTTLAHRGYVRHEF